MDLGFHVLNTEIEQFVISRIFFNTFHMDEKRSSLTVFVHTSVLLIFELLFLEEFYDYIVQFCTFCNSRFKIADALKTYWDMLITLFSICTILFTLSTFLCLFVLYSRFRVHFLDSDPFFHMSPSPKSEKKLLLSMLPIN